MHKKGSGNQVKKEEICESDARTGQNVKIKIRIKQMRNQICRLTTERVLCLSNEHVRIKSNE